MAFSVFLILMLIYPLAGCRNSLKHKMRESTNTFLEFMTTLSGSNWYDVEAYAHPESPYFKVIPDWIKREALWEFNHVKLVNMGGTVKVLSGEPKGDFFVLKYMIEPTHPFFFPIESRVMFKAHDGEMKLWLESNAADFIPEQITNKVHERTQTIKTDDGREVILKIRSEKLSGKPPDFPAAPDQKISTGQSGYSAGKVPETQEDKQGG